MGAGVPMHAFAIRPAGKALMFGATHGLVRGCRSAGSRHELPDWRRGTELLWHSDTSPVQLRRAARCLLPFRWCLMDAPALVAAACACAEAACVA